MPTGKFSRRPVRYGDLLGSLGSLGPGYPRRSKTAKLERSRKRLTLDVLLVSLRCRRYW